MGENAGGAAGGATFDGKLTAWPEEWPEKATINISNVPKDKKSFVLMMSCNMYMNQNITEPRKQALKSIEYAVDLYNALQSKGYL